MSHHDWKDVLTKHRDDLINDIEKTLMECGQWEDTAGIQTIPILFEHKSKHWEDVKNAFIDSCDKKPDYVRAWAYIERPGVDNNLYPGWHSHGDLKKEGVSFNCGVMYLDRFKQGTMFKKDDKEIVGDPTPFVWHTFSPHDVHCPPKWDPNSSITRYVIAAEAMSHHFRSCTSFWD